MTEAKFENIEKLSPIDPKVLAVESEIYQAVLKMMKYYKGDTEQIDIIRETIQDAGGFCDVYSMSAPKIGSDHDRVNIYWTPSEVSSDGELIVKVMVTRYVERPIYLDVLGNLDASEEDLISGENLDIRRG